jgi:hypothetical protein
MDAKSQKGQVSRSSIPAAFVEASLRKLMASVQPERHSKNIYKYEEESRFHFK